MRYLKSQCTISSKIKKIFIRKAASDESDVIGCAEIKKTFDACSAGMP